MTPCRRLRSLAFLIPALALAGCGPSPDTDSAAGGEAKANARQIVLLSATTANPFNAAQQQTLSFLVSRNKAASLQVEDAQNQSAKQMAQWQAAIAAKPFAIIVDAVDPEALAPAIKEAAGSGTLVIGLGHRMVDTGCSTVVWCDQRQLGRLAGEIAVRALTLRAKEENKPAVTGRLVQIRGDETSAECNERSAGFLEAVSGTPGLVLVHDAPGGWTKEGGAQRAQDALRLQKTFDAVYAHNDLMALGAAEAAGALRESMLLIGTDAFGGPTGGMTLVGNGDIDATVYQPLLVDFAWSILRKKLATPEFQPKPQYQLTPRAIAAKDIDDIRRNGLPKFPPL